MPDEERAREFAGAWVQAWNAHDLARILDDPSGTVSGKAALRSYFQRGLDVYPNLKFELLDVMWGLSILSIRRSATTSKWRRVSAAPAAISARSASVISDLSPAALEAISPRRSSVSSGSLSRP